MVDIPKSRVEWAFRAVERDRVVAATAASDQFPRARAATPVSRWDVAWKAGLLVVLAWLAWETHGVGQAIRELSAVQAQFRR